DLRNALDHLPQWNAPPEIAHGNRAALQSDLHLPSVAHDEFIDGVVDDLLHQDVAAIVGVGAIADATYVHAGAQADVLERREGLDLAFVVNVLLVFGHIVGRRISAKTAALQPELKNFCGPGKSSARGAG